MDARIARILEPIPRPQDTHHLASEVRVERIELQAASFRANVFPSSFLYVTFGIGFIGQWDYMAVSAIAQ